MCLQGKLKAKTVVIKYDYSPPSWPFLPVVIIALLNDSKGVGLKEKDKGWEVCADAFQMQLN